MSYKVIMRNGFERRMSFTSANFKNLKVWNVSFEDGQKAMLYKLGDEWMQHNDSELDRYSLLTIGQQIDHSLIDVEISS